MNMSNQIVVNDIFQQAGIREDQRTEFKTSLFFDSETHMPGTKQMHVIAETLAAFMNAEGGMLLIGVTDDKRPKGIENDLDVLANNPEAVVVRTVHNTDEGHVYGASTDKYELKLRAVVKAFLSPNAQSLVGDVMFGKLDGKTICRILVKPCAPEDFVYAYYKKPGKPEIANIFVRFGNLKRPLQGAERDAFVRERTRRQVLANVQAVNAQNADGLVARIVEAINTGFGPAVIGGAPVQVEGAVALDDPHFGALSSPKGLVFDGTHVCDVKGWREAYGELLVKLNELDAAKFDDLPETDYFRKFFVVARPRKKYPDYYKTTLGSASNIRGKEIANKTYFVNPTYVVHRLLARFGIEPGRVAVRG